MRLLEAARAEEVGPAPQCLVGRLLLRPPEGLTSDEIVEALASEVTSAALSRALAKVYGVRVGDHSIARHRRGHCRCEPPGSRAG